MGFFTDLWDSVAQLGSPLYNGIKAWWDGADSPEDYYNDVVTDYSPLAWFDSKLGGLGNVPGTDLPWTVLLIVAVVGLVVYLLFFRKPSGGGATTNIYLRGR